MNINPISQPRSVFRVIKMKRNCPSHRLPWTKPHDDFLVHLVEVHGERHWKKIETEMMARFPDFPANGKRCRERWLYVGRSGIDTAPLSEMETISLLAFHHQYANSWASIAKRIPNRGSSTLKNNFYSLIKKTAKDVSIFTKNRTVSEPSPYQYFVILYMGILLLDMLVVKDPIKDSVLEYNKSITPPHIAEYVYLLKVPTSEYRAYLLEIQSKCGKNKEWTCSNETIEKMKEINIENLKKFCDEISVAVLDYREFGPNEALSRTYEKVCCPAKAVSASKQSIAEEKLSQQTTSAVPPVTTPQSIPVMAGMWIPVVPNWPGMPVMAYGNYMLPPSQMTALPQNYIAPQSAFMGVRPNYYY